MVLCRSKSSNRDRKRHERQHSYCLLKNDVKYRFVIDMASLK